MVAYWRGLLTSTTARFIGLVFVLQLVATGSIFYYFRQASAATQRAQQQALVGELRDNLVAGFQEGGRPGLTSLIDARLRAVRTESAVILLATRAGKPIAGNLDAWPPKVAARGGWTILDLYRSQSARAERIGFVASTLPNGDHLLTGHVIESAFRQRQIDENTMITAFLLAIPLALLIAAIAARMVAQRVEAIARTASAVAGGNLSQRVPPSHGNDAFARLGSAINIMLSRIDALVGELRVVTDGLAHDLRSPITRLKSTLERAIVETDDPAALAALQSVSREAEALLSMLTTALQISRAEAGIGRDRFVNTEIKALLTDLVEVYGPYAEEHGFTMTAEAPEQLCALLHRELVSQAIGNLIENAIKYADGGSHIALFGALADRELTLSVADDGPGIPTDRHDDARKRFGRLDPARHITGSGLGLVLVEAVARLHDGVIALEDNAPGLCVILKLPTAAGDQLPSADIRRSSAN